MKQDATFGKQTNVRAANITVKGNVPTRLLFSPVKVKKGRQGTRIVETSTGQR